MKRHRYRTNIACSGLQHVDTGDSYGLFSVKTAEAKMLEKQQESNKMQAQGLNNQKYFLQAAGHINNELQGTRQDINKGFDRVDNTLTQGFDRVDNTLTQGFNQVDNTLNQGFSEVSNGLEQVSNSIHEAGQTLNNSLEKGFSQVSDDIITTGNQITSSIVDGFDSVNQSLDTGFNNLCSGLSTIDENLVAGFQQTSNAIENQTAVIDSRLLEVGNAMINNINLQHSLDRNTIAKVGQNIVNVFKQEGEANRATIIKAANLTITTLQNEGNITRDTLVQIDKNLKANINNLQNSILEVVNKHSLLMAEKLDNISNKLSRKAELESREHTKAALSFFKMHLYDEAKKALKQAIDAFMGYFPAIYVTGVIAMIEGDFESAQKYLTAAYSQAGMTDPNKKLHQLTMSLLLLGRIEALKGNWEEADKIFGRLVETNSKFIMAPIEQAYAIFHNRQRGEKQEDRLSLIVKGLDSMGKQSPLAWYGLSLLLARNYPKEALSALKRGLNINLKIKKMHPLEIFKILRETYPDEIPYLYAAILEFEPDLKWIINK